MSYESLHTHTHTIKLLSLSVLIKMVISKRPPDTFTSKTEPCFKMGGSCRSHYCPMMIMITSDNFRGIIIITFDEHNDDANRFSVKKNWGSLSRLVPDLIKKFPFFNVERLTLCVCVCVRGGWRVDQSQLNRINNDPLSLRERGGCKLQAS